MQPARPALSAARRGFRAAARRWLGLVCLLVLIAAPLLAMFEQARQLGAWGLGGASAAAHTERGGGADTDSETPDPLEGEREVDADTPEATRPAVERLSLLAQARASYLLDTPIPARPSTNPQLDSIHRPPRA